MGDRLWAGTEVNHLGMYPATQVDSAFYPLWDGKMNISLQAE